LRPYPIHSAVNRKNHFSCHVILGISQTKPSAEILVPARIKQTGHGGLYSKWPFAGAHRLGPAEAPGPVVFHPGYETAGGDGTATPADERYASFNQAFLTDARVEPEFLLSDVGNGWAVTTTTLMHERRGADALRSWAIPSDKPGRICEEEREEIRTTMEPYKWYPQRADRVDLILERARATGKINDPVLRQDMAKVLIMAKAGDWTARRARTTQEQGRGAIDDFMEKGKTRN
jgi:hypothetical protein